MPRAAGSKGGAKAKDKLEGAASAVMESDDGCKVCGKSVFQGENGVQYEICELWFHSQCQNLRDESYRPKALEQQNVHWFCRGCNGGAVKLFKTLLRLNFRQDIEWRKR